MLSLSTVEIFLVFSLCVLPHVCDDPAGADPIEDSSSVFRITDGVPTSKLGGAARAGGDVDVGASTGGVSFSLRLVECTLRLAEWPPLISSMNILQNNTFIMKMPTKVPTYVRKKNTSN